MEISQGFNSNQLFQKSGSRTPTIDPLIWRKAAGSIPFAEYVAINYELTTCETLSDDMIIANANAITVAIEEEEEESEDAVIPTIKAVRKGLENFCFYLQAHAKDTNDLQELLNSLQHKFNDFCRLPSLANTII